MEAQRKTTHSFEQIALARQIILDEAQALQRLAQRLPADFEAVVEAILACTGSIVVTGIGKAGWIGQKISATLASTGSRSHFMHPSEAMHGDLGRVRPDDLVLILTNSGETEEILRMLPSLKRMGVRLIALTASPHNTVAREATWVLDYGLTHEACPMGLAPSTSTTAMLGLGDALALVAAQVRGFGPMDFAVFHPGGSLGRQLALVDELMRPLVQCRVASDQTPVRQVYAETAAPGRRTGAILCCDSAGCLSGIFTDSDLARLLETKRDAALDGPIGAVMTARPVTVRRGTRLSDAIDVLAEKSISELPVVDESQAPVGMIDITDLIGLVPALSSSDDDAEAACEP